jgi:hypothetical protein
MAEEAATTHQPKKIPELRRLSLSDSREATLLSEKRPAPVRAGLKRTHWPAK